MNTQKVKLDFSMRGFHIHYVMMIKSRSTFQIKPMHKKREVIRVYDLSLNTSLPNQVCQPIPPS